MPFCQWALTARNPPQDAYPVQPKTLGELIKKRRLDLGLTQKEVATRIGTSPWTILNWEGGRTDPATRFKPGIDQFLG